MPGKTLGLRRLQCRRSDLLPLKKAIFSIPAMMHAKTKTFIDNSGYAFIYSKTLSSKLTCYKIDRVDKKGEASLVWLIGIPFPVTVPRPPLPGSVYARMLHLGDVPWMIYDYVSSPTKDTYRRV